MIAATEAHKTTPASYKPPAENKSMRLSSTHSRSSEPCTPASRSASKEDFGLAAVPDGVTAHHISLINVLAIVMTVVVLLEIVDYTSYILRVDLAPKRTGALSHNWPS